MFTEKGHGPGEVAVCLWNSWPGTKRSLATSPDNRGGAFVGLSTKSRENRSTTSTDTHKQCQNTGIAIRGSPTEVWKIQRVRMSFRANAEFCPFFWLGVQVCIPTRPQASLHALRQCSPSRCCTVARFLGCSKPTASHIQDPRPFFFPTVPRPMLKLPVYILYMVCSLCPRALMHHVGLFAQGRPCKRGRWAPTPAPNKHDRGRRSMLYKKDQHQSSFLPNGTTHRRRCRRVWVSCASCTTTALGRTVR